MADVQAAIELDQGFVPAAVDGLFQVAHCRLVPAQGGGTAGVGGHHRRFGAQRLGHGFPALGQQVGVDRFAQRGGGQFDLQPLQLGRGQRLLLAQGAEQPVGLATAAGGGQGTRAQQQSAWRQGLGDGHIQRIDGLLRLASVEQAFAQQQGVGGRVARGQCVQPALRGGEVAAAVGRAHRRGQRDRSGVDIFGGGGEQALGALPVAGLQGAQALEKARATLALAVAAPGTERQAQQRPQQAQRQPGHRQQQQRPGHGGAVVPAAAAHDHLAQAGRVVLGQPLGADHAGHGQHQHRHQPTIGLHRRSFTASPGCRAGRATAAGCCRAGGTGSPAAPGAANAVRAPRRAGLVNRATGG